MRDLLADRGAQNTLMIWQVRSRFTPGAAAGRAGKLSPSEAIRGHATERPWFHGLMPSRRAIRFREDFRGGTWSDPVFTKGNYAASWGNTGWGQLDIVVNGRRVFYQPSAFSLDSRLDFGSVRDGLSTTVFMAEMRKGALNDTRGLLWSCYSGAYVSRFAPNGFNDYYGSGV